MATKRHKELVSRVREIEADLGTGCAPDIQRRAARERTARELLHEFSRSDDAELRRRAIDAANRAFELAFPPGFCTDYEAVKSGDPGGLEGMIRFLEADPRFFRSGYTKENVLKYVSRFDLDERVRWRLQRVVLRQVDTRDSREFRRYCRLARAIDSSELRAALERRTAGTDADIRRRAEWMLDGLSTREFEPPVAKQH